MTGHRVQLDEGADPSGFRLAVRRLLAAAVPPDEVAWTIGRGSDLFGSDLPEEAPPVPLPRALHQLVEPVVCHSDPERYALLYTLTWRVRHGEPALLQDPSDPLVHRLERMRKAIRRDVHKMHAFLRFRRTEDPNGAERFVAWFEPEHHILDAAAPFFVDRFRSMAWSILTPSGSRHWDGRSLLRGPPATRADAPEGDAFEAGWRGYYESVFNPARVNPGVMRGEMPKKYWRNMPEAQAIPHLIRSAPARVRDMLEQEAAMPAKRNPDKAVASMFDQEPRTLEELNRIIAASEPLVPGATRAVLGEGPIGAAIALVGEQPGDQEDLQGHPFVGPAGQLLDQVMTEAAVDRGRVYITNAVKHFKFEQRGKRRIHQKPTAGEVKHYRWWLMRELDFVRPELTVALGVTALLALAGKALPIGKNRGEMMFEDRPGFVTVHPSYLLRLPDEAAKRQAYDAYLADFRRMRRMVERIEAASA
ncbi:UdgX family uracil-DNA binding protein [Marinivivus vitaminiproducens]|uniref:UdgX family uracil-DNA binding protein n=1 Tax=Marinivivus vitaminiproducens TaxID=3035935 RepID=UPI0027A6BB6A|nr:UdgX family uracil-DNA binding protein [Geminicoccaceae bacterium SCSIO 64248]